jgi:hypothetical protein
METHPLDQQPNPQEDGHQSSDRVSEEVADTTAHVHVEGKGLDPELERRFEDD